MPRKGIIIYDLLISCPSDVVKYLEIIKECIESFNRTFGDLNNIEIVTKHWSTNSYPESGDKPQELLNKQFVRDCDAAVAIFWTRFGTPTDKYESGTEEEIEEMLSAKKQVFMYFLNDPITPTELDQDQYKKVLEFRKKYKDKGVYAIVDNELDFQRQFTNHLSLYFLSLISESEDSKSKALSPILKIRDANTLSEKCCSLSRTQLLESKFIKNQKDKIIGSFETLNNFILPKHSKKLNSDLNNFNELTYTSRSYEQISKIVGTSNFVEVNEDWIKDINEFANKNQINIEEKFWNLGNLKSYYSQLQFPFGSSGPSYYGTDEEKKRYSLLKNLYLSIKEYNEYNEYFGYIDNVKVLRLMISNLGNTFDEDIDIKLIIPKGYILKYKDLPYPGPNIIENLLDMKLFDFIFLIPESDTVNKYEESKEDKLKFSHVNKFSPILPKSIEEEYEDNKYEYKILLDEIFSYKQFESLDSDILIFDIKYLKHNSSMAFPSILMFKNIPEIIEYEITSKHIPKIIKGKMYINDVNTGYKKRIQENDC